MDMNEEKWINEVMNSLDGVKSAEASPFLYTRVLSRIENKERALAPARLIWLAAACLVALIGLNIFLMKMAAKDTSTASDSEQIAAQYQLTNTFSYN